MNVGNTIKMHAEMNAKVRNSRSIKLRSEKLNNYNYEH